MLTCEEILNLPIEWRSPKGYVRVVIPGHPLAGSRDRVLRHRAVAHRIYGWSGDTHWCTWCGYELPWRAENSDVRYYLNVDHVNGVPGDDWISNLAVSCWWCNIARSWCDRHAPGWWAWLPSSFAEIPPWARPSTLDVMCAHLGVDWIDISHKNEPEMSE